MMKILRVHLHRIQILALILLLLFIVSTIKIYTSISGGNHPLHYIDNIMYDLLTRKLRIRWTLDKDTTILSANLGIHLSNVESVEVICQPNGINTKCFQWEEKMSMQLSLVSRNLEEKLECYNVHWTAHSHDVVPMDCIDIGHARWYGGASLYRQSWPIEKTPVHMQPFISNDVGTAINSDKGDVFGAVIERYWLNSEGISLVVADDVPLHVSINSTHLCFKAHYDHLSYANPLNKLPALNYTICTKDNVKSMHQYITKALWRRPMGIPDIRLFKDPIWSTWARFKKNITQEKVIRFADDVRSYGFSGCQIEIDDQYSSNYGDFDFDPKKFPDVPAMVKKIHDLGFRITSWVVPFANIESEAFHYGVKKNYWMKVEGNIANVPGLVKWWRGLGAVLDITNKEAIKWFFEGTNKRIKNLLGMGVDSFKFDAGETNLLPLHLSPAEPFLHGNPSYYSTQYAEAAVSHAEPILEVRVGFKTQHLPTFVRMYDKSSDWSYKNGLKTLIPTALIFGILGYPFVLPDMIGGNGYNVSGLPDKELYIRWLGVNTFLPSMQFSIAPWQYDPQTVLIALKMIKLRTEYVVPKILQLAQESTETGFPIIRPVWWIDPENPKTFDIDDQFLVGDSVLVAPILGPGQTNRNIYLPNGRWKDMLRGSLINGGKYLMNYNATLEEIPYFEKISDT